MFCCLLQLGPLSLGGSNSSSSEAVIISIHVIHWLEDALVQRWVPPGCARMQPPYLNHKLLLEPFLQPSKAEWPSKALGAPLGPLTQAPLCSPFPITDLSQCTCPSSGWDEPDPAANMETSTDTPSPDVLGALSTLSSSGLSRRASLINTVSGRIRSYKMRKADNIYQILHSSRNC